MTIEFERVGVFDACGRVRDRKAEQDATCRRQHDEILAARCIRLGMNPYRAGDPITAVDILTKGEKTRDLGRPLLHRRFFHTVAATENQGVVRPAYAFFQSFKPSKLVEVVVRPKRGKPLTKNYRDQHKEHVGQVGAAIKELKRLGIAEALFLVRHPRPIANGHAIDLHSHLLLDVRPERMDDLTVFLATRFSTDERGIASAIDPMDRVHYLLQPWHWRMDEDVERAFNPDVLKDASDIFPKGLSLPRGGEETGFDDPALLLFWEATASLRWYECLGPLRRFRQAAVPAGTRLTETLDGRIVLARKRTKAQRKAGALELGAGPLALAARLSWIEGVLRPVILVQHWSGSWDDLASRYDLRAIVRRAHDAWDAAHAYPEPPDEMTIVVPNSGNPPNRKNKNNQTPGESGYQNPYWLASRGEPWDYALGPPPWGQ